ncbi:hypothetical protein C8J57DRAFT_1476377 [Mycena rebaudengoi]|nr:hypothetical protein C8J57DRAFT_1476377 [Mycena rebaudengoi]
MAITRNSARTASPTPSDSSDVYWENFDDPSSPSPAPSQTADAFGWESGSSPAPMDSNDATPTPQVAHTSPAASVGEISRDDFPPLEPPAPTTTSKPRGKHRARHRRVTRPLLGDGQYDRRASSSRRPMDEPESPSKRLRANTVGEAAPAPFAASVPTPFLAPMPASTATAAPTAADSAAQIAPPAAATATTYAAAAAAPAPVAPIVAPVAAPAPVVAPAPPDAAAGAALPPLWLTADGLPLRGSYTPTPAGGFPTIVYSPEQLLHGVPLDLVRMYNEVPHPKFFLVVSGGNGAVMRTHGLIRDAIGNFVNVDPTGFTLGTPPTAANGPSPSLWLAADIPNHLAQAIVDNRIISSTSTTLFPLPYDMPVIGFVGVFAGFTLPNTDAGADAARDLIRAAIANNSEIAQFVQTHRDAFGPQVSAVEAWTTFLASVTVRGIVLLANDTNTVAWRLHVNPPTNNRESWGELRRLFSKVQIMTARYGMARLQRAFRCRICPSIDHPTPLCPLPDIPGWLGPTPTTIAALEDASRAAAAKAQEQMRLNSFTPAGGSGSNSGNGRSQGAPNKKPRGDGKGKKGNDYKGKGKRRERDDFF